MYETVYSTANHKYEMYEKQSHSRYNRRCIDSSITGCGNCVGYCQYSKHPGFLTEKLRKQHNCIGKQCFHYVPKPEKKKVPQLLVDLSSSILTLAHRVMSEDECVRVIRVENTEFNQYTAFYVTITNECQFDGYASRIEDELGIRVSFQKLNYDFDKCVALLCAG